MAFPEDKDTNQGSKEHSQDLGYYMNLSYEVTLSKDSENIFVAEIKDLPGCFAQGKTIEEAWESIQEAKGLWIEAALEIGKEIPSQYKGILQVRMPPFLHALLCEVSRYQKTSLNQLIGRVLDASNIVVETNDILEGTSESDGQSSDKAKTAARRKAKREDVFSLASGLLNESNYSGRLTLRIDPSLHKQLVRDAQRNGVSLNKHIVHFLKEYAAYILTSTPILKEIKRKDRYLARKEEERHREKLLNAVYQIHQFQKVQSDIFFDEAIELNLSTEKVAVFLDFLAERIQEDVNRFSSYDSDLQKSNVLNPLTSFPHWQSRAESLIPILRAAPEARFNIPNLFQFYEKLAASVSNYKQQVFEHYKSRRDHILSVESFINGDAYTIQRNLQSYNELIGHCLIVGDADLLYTWGLESFFSKNSLMAKVPKSILQAYQEAFQGDLENSTSMMPAVYLTILRDTFRDLQDKEYVSRMRDLKGLPYSNRAGLFSSYYEDLSAAKFFFR